MDRPLVLVAEDNAELRDVLTVMLTNWNYRVIVAKDGFEAVDMVRLHAPDLVLMDLRMPKMDGYEATRRLKYEEATRAIPVVAVTASVLWATASELHRIGFAGYVMKPIVPDDLRDSVRLCLSDSNSIPE